MVFLSSLGAEVEEGMVAVEVDVEVDVNDDVEVDEGMEDVEFDGDIMEVGRLVTAVLFAAPFGSATMDPKDFTFSALTTGADAGDEEMGAAASSMEPKVTEPCFAAGMLRGIETPSFTETP